MIFGSAIFSAIAISAVLVSSCASSVDSRSSNIALAASTPASLPKNVAEENFEKEWKTKYESALAELERDRALWQKTGPLNYDFVAAKMAGGTTNTWNRSPVVIKVRENEKTSIELQSKTDNLYMSKVDGFEDIDSIPKLFDYLRRELEAGKMLEIEYDKKFGYPKDIMIILSRTSHGGRSIEITKLEAVK